MHRQTASALLTALFVTAIAAVLSVAIIAKLSILIHLTSLNNFADQGYLYLVGVRDQFSSDLINYTLAWSKPAGNQSLMLPKAIGPQQFEGTTLYGTLADQQARFNINQLISPNNQSKFIALLKAIEPNIDTQQTIQLARNVTDWLSSNNVADQIYDKYDPPYRAAHQPMVDISELRLVAGMTPTLYQKLSPYLTALPLAQNTESPVNINTAPPAVLTTLGPGLSLQRAQILYSCRQEHGEFLSINDYNETCVRPLGIQDFTDITIKSRFFMIQSSATNTDQQVFLRSLVMTVVDAKNKIQTPIIWQQFN